MGPAWDRLWTAEGSGPEQLSEQFLSLFRSELERLEARLNKLENAKDEQPDLVHKAAKQSGPVPHDHLDCERCDGIVARGRTAGITQVMQYYENIPGITELREEAALKQATITLVGDGWASQKKEDDIWGGWEDFFDTK